MDSSDDNFTNQFFSKWVEYYEMISIAESVQDIGRNLTEDEKVMLTEEQKENLAEFKKLVVE